MFPKYTDINILIDFSSTTASLKACYNRFLGTLTYGFSISMNINPMPEDFYFQFSNKMINVKT